MKIYPAIDIKGGKCVRLLQGRAEDATIYGDDPGAMAKKWVSMGAEYLHVVDLDGAFSGKGKNLEAVKAICQNAGSVPVQLGGGIRSMEDAEKRFELGVTRVILGTSAINNPEFVRMAAKRFNGRIVAGIDAKDGMVAISGWIDVTDISAIELAKKLYDFGIDTCVYTDISLDGMMKGPNFEATDKLNKSVGMDIIASGGVSSIEDIIKLREMGIHGAITGKAIYDGTINLLEAIRRLK